MLSEQQRQTLAYFDENAAGWQVLANESGDAIVHILQQRYQYGWRVAEEYGPFERVLDIMDFEQLEEMVADGMYIGCHGYNHDWMNSLTREEQERDVDRAIDILSSIPGSEPGGMFCFPYGGYNGDLLSVLRQRSFSVAVTVDVRLADMSIDDPLLLPRLDTIHLPFRGDAPIHDWTYRVSGVGRN